MFIFHFYIKILTKLVKHSMLPTLQQGIAINCEINDNSE